MSSKLLPVYDQVIQKLEELVNGIPSDISSQAIYTIIDLLKTIIYQLNDKTLTTVDNIKQMLAIVQQAHELQFEINHMINHSPLESSTTSPPLIIKHDLEQLAKLRDKVSTFEELQQRYNEIKDKLQTLQKEIDVLQSLGRRVAYTKESTYNPKTPLNIILESYHKQLLETYTAIIKPTGGSFSEISSNIKKAIANINKLESINGLDNAKSVYAKNIMTELLRLYQNDLQITGNKLIQQRNKLVSIGLYLLTSGKYVENIFSTYSISDIISMKCINSDKGKITTNNLTPGTITLLTQIFILADFEIQTTPIDQLTAKVCKLLEFPEIKITVKEINEIINRKYNSLPPEEKKTVPSNIIDRSYTEEHKEPLFAGTGFFSNIVNLFAPNQ